MGKFEGIIPAMITPFFKNEISAEKLEKEILFLNNYGFKTVFLLGSYGGFPNLFTYERKKVCDIVSKKCKELNMKFIVQVGSTNFFETLELIENAEKNNANAISLVVPYYYTGTKYLNENGILKYFEKLLKYSILDIHIYNNQTTTKFYFSIKFLKNLYDIGVSGIKDGGANPERIKSIIEYFKDKDFSYYPSSTKYIIDTFKYGAKSCVSGLSLIAPNIIMDIYKNITEGKIIEAEILHKKIMEIRNILGKNYGRAISIHYLKKETFGSEVRLPWEKPNNKEIEFMRQELEDYGIL